MNKKVKIVDFAGSIKTIILKDISSITSIKVKILTGDEVLKVMYKDGHSKTYDSCSGIRLANLYDGEYELSLDKLDEFAKGVGSSYERLAKFGEN